jgi:hypothetical protein
MGIELLEDVVRDIRLGVRALMIPPHPAAPNPLRSAHMPAPTIATAH